MTHQVTIYAKGCQTTRDCFCSATGGEDRDEDDSPWMTEALEANLSPSVRGERRLEWLARDTPPIRQYGVQIVWKDPVKSGATPAGGIYEPRWSWFDSEKHADTHAKFYQCTMGDMAKRMPTLSQTEGFNPDEIWTDSAVEEVIRAERWALAIYSDPEIVSSDRKD